MGEATSILAMGLVPVAAGGFWFMYSLSGLVIRLLRHLSF